MDYKVLKTEQVKEQADGVLLNRARQLAEEQIRSDIENKRLKKVSASFDEETAALLAPQIETSDTALAEVNGKLDRARQSVADLKDSEVTAMRVTFLRQYLVQIESEYASHFALATERKRVIESGELTEDELPLVQMHWQENQVAMQSLDAAHSVVLEEMAALKIDPASAAPDAPTPNGVSSGVLPAPEPPQPKASKTKAAKEASS